MKKLLTLATIILIVGLAEVSKAQLAKDSWSLGFGFKYPRFLSVNTTALNGNYGGYISLQRNFSEHIGARFKAGYGHMESSYFSGLGEVTATTNIITGDLDFLYYLAPCEPVSPYLFGGVGGNYRMLSDYLTPTLEENAFIMQFNAGAGIEWCLDEDWKLVTEFAFHQTSNSSLDGAVMAAEASGNDSYIGLSLGLQYFIDKGTPSKYCQLYTGITQGQKDLTDYAKIEEMIKAHIPKEITKEIVVEKPAKAFVEKWVLVGVNFDNNSSKLTAESYPLLFDAVKTLLKNPDMKVEIEGYTDNIGSESYNQKLSERRAEAVKKYLVSKGVAESRLTVLGKGESNPVADNATADGRAMNRRIEFKVQ
ncbi:MAG: OmpA/MotB domain protein [Ignavibacteria bacterium]|nr:MAG: OmpA/MotB domain protein [Ignavibacteria bacterium]KAF0159579.1 MAG: OmpA/MotB domain protein [Ignavibacteria bacterium]